MSRENIFITALSNINPRNFKEADYQYRVIRDKELCKPEDADTYKGYFSGEPGIRCAIRQLAEEGELFDRYVIFCSEKTMKKEDISELLSNTDRDILSGLLGESFRYTDDSDKSSEHNIEKIEVPITFSNISAYEYIEAVIRYEVKSAVNGTNGMAILSWLEEKGYTGQTEDEIINSYVNAACHINGDVPIDINDNPNIEELKRNIEGSVNYLARWDGESVDTEPTDIYLDITGGTRITSLVSLLISQWYKQKKQANVKKVLYSSIMDDKVAAVIDWTENFELFDIADSKTKLKNVSILSNYVGNAFSKDEWNLLNKYINESCNTQSDDEIENRVTVLEAFRNRIYDDHSIESIETLIRIDDAIDNYSSTQIQNLKKLDIDNPGEYIEKFYGHIYNTLEKKDVLKVKVNESVSGIVDEKYNKLTMKEALSTNELYYARYNKKNQLNGGVIFFVSKMVRFLNVNKDPKAYWNQIRNIDNKYYERWNEPSYTLRGANSVLNKYFLDGLNSPNHKIRKSKQFNVENNILEYEGYRNLYFNYGFPFACIGDKNHIFEDVRDYYIKEVGMFIDEIREFYDSNKEAYENELDYYCDPKDGEARLMKKIKIYKGPECVIANIDKFESEDEAKEFITSFNKLMEKVRNVRNAHAHPEQPSLDKYRTDEVIQKIAEEIKIWIEDHRNLVC